MTKESACHRLPFSTGLCLSFFFHLIAHYVLQRSYMFQYSPLYTQYFCKQFFLFFTFQFGGQNSCNKPFKVISAQNWCRLRSFFIYREHEKQTQSWIFLYNLKKKEHILLYCILILRKRFYWRKTRKRCFGTSNFIFFQKF